jgi:hypothetical protein
MRCTIYHNNIIALEILSIHIKCRKGLIAYHKSNGITTVQIHVEFDHFALLDFYFFNETIMALKFPLDHKPSKKRAHVFSTTIFGFFSIIGKFKKDDVTQMGFVEDLMLFVVKGCYL